MFSQSLSNSQQNPIGRLRTWRGRRSARRLKMTAQKNKQIRKPLYRFKVTDQYDGAQHEVTAGDPAEAIALASILAGRPIASPKVEIVHGWRR